MGVKGAFKLLAKVTEISKNGPQKQVVVIDGSYLVYNTFLATKAIRTMTAPDGKTPTGHIRIIYNKIKRFHKDGCRLVVVWDAGTTTLKEELKKDREEQKDKAKEKFEKAKADGMTGDGLARLEKLGVSPGRAFESAKKLFALLGVPQLTVPEKYEAEHLCAQICSAGIGDVVYTKDSDALFFGGTAMGWHHRGKYNSIKLADALKHLEVNLLEFQRMGVMLGTDFAPKSAGIGPATVLKPEAREKVKFTERQEKALKMLQEKIGIEIPFTRESLTNTGDEVEIKKYLTTLGFRKI